MFMSFQVLRHWHVKNMLTWTWHHRTFHYIDILFFPPSLTLQQGQGGYGNRSQSSRLAESQLMFQPDGSNNQQAGNSDVETQNEKTRISNRMFPRSWKKECCAEWLVKCMSSFEFVEIDMSHWHWLIVFRVKESETRKTYLLQRLKSTPAHLDALTLSSWLASFFVEWKANLHSSLHRFIWNQRNTSAYQRWKIQASIMPHLVATAVGSLRDSQHCCSFRPFQPCWHWHQAAGM